VKLTFFVGLGLGLLWFRDADRFRASNVKLAFFVGLGLGLLCDVDRFRASNWKLAFFVGLGLGLRWICDATRFRGDFCRLLLIWELDWDLELSSTLSFRNTPSLRRN